MIQRDARISDEVDVFARGRERVEDDVERVGRSDADYRCLRRAVAHGADDGEAVLAEEGEEGRGRHEGSGASYEARNSSAFSLVGKRPSS